MLLDAPPCTTPARTPLGDASIASRLAPLCSPVRVSCCFAVVRILRRLDAHRAQRSWFACFGRSPPLAQERVPGNHTAAAGPWSPCGGPCRGQQRPHPAPLCRGSRTCRCVCCHGGGGGRPLCLRRCGRHALRRRREEWSRQRRPANRPGTCVAERAGGPGQVTIACCPRAGQRAPPCKADHRQELEPFSDGAGLSIARCLRVCVGNAWHQAC